MATNIKGLPGLNRLSEQERQMFMLSNEEKLRKYRKPGDRKRAAEMLYNNRLFKQTFGEDTFNQLNNGTEEAYNLRNSMLTEKAASDAFSQRFSPWNEDHTARNNNKGLGADYEKYFGYVDPTTGQRVGGMSSEGLIKALESDYLSPAEFENNWKNQSDALSGINRDKEGKATYINPWLNIGGLSQALGRSEATGEAAKQRAKERNNRILEHIYNDESEEKAASLGSVVSQAYQDPNIVGHDDEETLQLFKEAITPDRATGNMGIPEYASHYGIVEDGISSEMKDFSIDDMRDVLAKKAVYDRYMSSDMAMTALNNEAKRYIHDHQGFGKKAELFAKDVLISSASYTADKVNGLLSIGASVADALGESAIVWVDTQGNIVDTTKNQFFKDTNGNVFYTDGSGQRLGVHREQVSRAALFNMGKNTNGSDWDSWLNPQDWTRREQFGVWDKDIAKQYEQIGSSPYKVAYNPNDDRDLLYESFKMMSFGLADAGAQLIPFGIGAAGKALSTASNVGRVVRGLGTGINTATKFLVAGEGTAGKIGATVQGLSGAIGIAEAYQRGAFQETLAQNLTNLEQSVIDRSRNEIYEQYNNDESYRKSIDSLVDARAASMKAEYMASLGEDAQKQIVDKSTLDDAIRSRAQEQVLSEMVQSRVNEHKNSKDYAAMQERAINGAGWAATNTFWPEAIKYGLVNTIGFRKFFYTTPTSVTQKAINNFKGLREITTSTGRRRLTTDAYKTLTNAEKWKNFGKVAGSQIWGGAWTNGTDDMMVDAAERINEDSYNRYLQAYENGEALADTYSFADGLWSYWKGLQNSLGQETTGEATLVGGLGSTISGNLHFTNIASLATKEGREAFRNNFQQRYKRDADGMIVRGEDGKPVVERVGWKDNWRDRLGFFIQNGVLNTYYGKKQELRNLQEHADFVNNILDDLDDFSSIENLVSSNIGRENALNIGDEKTMRFVQAFNAIHALEQLGKDEKDPSTLSSVVMHHKDMIEKASKLGTEDSEMTEEEINNLLGQYYSNNPGLAQTEENNQIALQNIAQNARKLQEAYQAYNEAEESIQNIERDKGAPIVPSVRFKMKMSQALDGHWRERLQTMKDEIGDASSDALTEGEALIAAVGGKRKADKILKDFSIQENILLQGVSDAVSQQQKMLDEYNKAQQTLRNAEENGDSEAILQAQKDLKEANDNYDESIEERMFREDMLTSAREKQQRLQDAINTWEKGTKSKVLSADEIMSLDPVTRAKMLEELTINPLTGEKQTDPYNAAQRKQIEKLKARLKSQDKTGDPLQKIQDIALLTQRIAQNEDAYHRLSRNPDAAAVQLEKQQKEAAEKAVDLINRRNAITLASYIDQMDYALIGRKDVSQKQKEDYVYRTLRNKNTTLLDIIEEDNLLPYYYPQVQKAKEWAHITSDIDAVLSNMDRDETQSTAIRQDIDRVIEPSTSKEEIITNLERAIDNSTDAQRQKDYEDLLDGLQKLGYQRDATVIENRKQRKEREEAQRKAEEERRAKLEAAVKEAAERQAAEEARRKAEEEEKRKKNESGVAATQTEQDRLLEGSEGVDLGDLGFDETPAEGAADTVVSDDAVVQQPAERKITTTATSKSGKTVNGSYSVNTDADGFTHVKRDGGPAIAQRQVKPSEMHEIGLTEEDILGKREDYNTPENYDALKKVYDEEGFKIEDITIRPDGTVAVNHNEDYFELQGEKAQKFLDKVFPELGAGDVAETKGEDSSKPIDVLVDWAEGRISGEDAIKQLDGTDYVKHTKGNPGLGTKDGVHLSNKVEWELGKYVAEKYPFLSYGNVSVATGVSTFGGNMNLIVVKDAEGNEYGTPSNFLRSLATNPNGRAAKAVKKGVEAIQQKAETSVSSTMEVHDEVLGDVIQGKSPTLEEQVTEAQKKEGMDVQITLELTDGEKENTRGEEEIETSPTVLSGNAMSEYESQALKEHRLVHKRGAKEDDSMNQYYEWLENAGIKLQNIIDDELPQILEQNPHTPVKFMRLRPSPKTVKNDFRSNTLMLVIDYTNDVEKVHNEDNGGVITSGGKKYLIVGTVGYGNKEKTPDKYSLWRMLMDDYAPNSHKLRLQAWNWFKKPENRAELYYVHPDFHTEVVPNSMIPGYLIRQNENDEAEPSRSIGQLLADRERNPHNLKLDDLAWGIQTLTGFSTINAGSKVNKILRPQESIDNSGRVFVLLPAGNGKLAPAKVEALKYNDPKFNKDGRLYNKLQDLLNQVVSPNYADRKDAISKLVQVLYFNPDKGGDNILIGQDEYDNRVTVVHGNQRTTFLLDSTFNREDFFKAIEDMNPRINVTARALLDKNSLRDLDEAGALMLDVTKLGTSGISYSIYGIDSEGKMITPRETRNTSSESETTFQEKNIRAFPYLHGETYRYNAETGKFTLNGVEVTNDDMIEYAYKIAVGELAPVKQQGVWDYYIISTGENPEVVRQSNKTKAIEMVGKEEAQRIINEEAARVAEEKRKLALEQALAEQDSPSSEETFINEDDGSLDFFNEELEQPVKEERVEQAPVAQQAQPSQSVEGNVAQSNTQTFKQLWRGPNRSKLLDVLRQKDWTDIPMDDMAALKKYLEDKGISNLDRIGTSEDDFNAWLQVIACK